MTKPYDDCRPTDASVRRRDEVRSLVERLGSATAAAEHLGLSPQRVYQLVNRGRRRGDPPWRPDGGARAVADILRDLLTDEAKP